MGNILRCPSGKSLLLIPGTGCRCIVNAAISSFWPELDEKGDFNPATIAPMQEKYTCILVRDPVERFRSMAAKSSAGIEKLFLRSYYWPIPDGEFRYFKFETQIKECADWLEITSPVVVEPEPGDLPELTEYQQSMVKSMYSKDLLLWQSL